MTTLLKPAEVTTAYLKMALMGFQGSGKTYTATETAIGLVLMMRELKLPAGDKPIAFMDTEQGSSWIKGRVDAASVGLVTAKTRAFTDLLAAIPEAQANASVLLIDSLTHFWVELTETYCKKKAAEFKRPSYRLQFQDWAYLKAEWRKFTDLFVNSPVHIIVAGRAGYEYDFIEDEDTKKKQLEKTGIKLKAEGEMGYEPDLLVLMERRMNMETKQDEHIAHVLKDRAALLDGKEFVEPTFKNFLPHIRCLNLGGKQLGIDTSRTSAASIPAEAPRDKGAIQRRIAAEEIQALLVDHVPGQTVTDKRRKQALLRKHFNVTSWTEIEEVMSLFDLRAGYESLHLELEGKPGRYGKPAPVANSGQPRPTLAEDLDDAIPEHDSVAGDPIPLPKPITIKDRLISDIGYLPSVTDCVRWGLAMHDTAEMLSKKDRAEVEAALIAHQSTLINGTGARA